MLYTNRLFRLYNVQLKEWYKNNTLNMTGYFDSTIHNSDVSIQEKYPDFFFDKVNLIKLYYIPYMIQNINGINNKQLLEWAYSMKETLNLIILDDFIILPWYPNAKPLTKELLKDTNIKNKLDLYTKNLISIQSNLDLKLIPKDYPSMFLVDNNLKVLTLFDFEVGYNPRERIVFCDEELVSYNIDNGILIQHNSKESLKTYLMEKDQRCIKF